MKIDKKKWLLVSGLVLCVLIWRNQLRHTNSDMRPLAYRLYENPLTTLNEPSVYSSTPVAAQQVEMTRQSQGADSNSDTHHVEELSEQCVKATSINLGVDFNSSLLPQAKTNARYLLDEFRKVIPQSSLDSYQSHCWKESFSALWDRSAQYYSGHVGNISFLWRQLERNFHANHKLHSLSRAFPNMAYESNLACLPDVFLAGFPKCGSTFLHCFISKLISLSAFKSLSVQMSVAKEPHFWVAINAAHANNVPTAGDIGGYFLNFLPGLHLIADSKRKDGILMDGSVNLLFNWPRFRETEHDLTNYCLLPSVLPVLLPHSKYVVIMRNPIKMLYSSFWFSCTSIGVKLSQELLLKGPDLFHERIVSKLDMFNNCMRDISVPSISNVCELDSKHTYSSCIQQRLHLLDKCTHKIAFHLFSPELDKCGRSRVDVALYYVHIRKWLSVVPRDRFLFLTFEEMTQDYKQTASDILTFLDLETGIVSEGIINDVTKSCDSNKNSQSSIDYTHNPKLQMRNDTQTLLERFYHPFNSMLAKLLAHDKFMW